MSKSRTLVSLTLLASSYTCIAAEPLTLARDGKSNAIIVLPREASSAARETAVILTDHLKHENHHLAVNVATVAWGSWGYFGRYHWSEPSPNVREQVQRQ